MSNHVADKGSLREGSGAVGDRGRVRYIGVDLISTSRVLLPPQVHCCAHGVYANVLATSTHLSHSDNMLAPFSGRKANGSYIVCGIRGYKC